MSESARTWRAQALLPRLATIVIGAPLLIAVIVIGGHLLTAAVLLLTLLGALEYRGLAFAAGHQPMVRAGALFYPLLAGVGLWGAAGAVTVGIVMVSASLALLPGRRAGAPVAAAVDTLGAIYVGGLFAHLILFRSEAGVAPILTILGAIWLGDIAAYLVGVRWGRRRLAPDISPGKSVEGLIAGLVVATVAALASAAWNGWPPLSVGLIGLCSAAAGVIGDLFKSTMKRAAGVKDSARLLPGHGGILDRFDAVLFGVPVGYYMWGWLM
ncbi:MAG TPA: phosphatidate cytidylyltransferase [bacterium]|nr:phosphatidate cytidylyltransferase [bacterium]